ncbi:MAG TPA: hypothetical protein VFK47_14115 [Ktedonobacteraceae bacterium]|nr:hypothetical protein [Ktedonobacteraceae bacterium]
MKDPVGAYGAMRVRLDEGGPNAPFPEFKPAVDYVRSQLDTVRNRQVLAEHPDLALEKNEVLTYLAHINLKFSFDDEANYPYGRPFAAPYPYRPTLDAIESSLRLLDKFSRLASDSMAVPLYHFDRYAYRRHELMADEDVVLMPTARNIRYEDFVRTRAVPIGFVGLSGTELRVDRHWQTPLDFAVHDQNHVRRMAGYSKLSNKAASAHTLAEKLAHYQSIDDFINQTLLPTIEELPQDAPEADRAVRNLARAILFEILHESALTAEKDAIIGDMLRGPGPQPFEHMVAPGSEQPASASETEKLRTPTGNLQSGASLMRGDDGEPITVRFFQDRSLGLLATVFNKLNYGFYDDPDAPSDNVAPPEYRTPEYMLKAAHYLFDALGYTGDLPSDQELLALITSQEGGERKFTYRGVAANQDRKLQYATEPLPVSEVIQQIKDLGKNVIALFGFSYLGYENPNEVMQQISHKLGTFDPETDIITIGATEEGIGAAYKVAKGLGFTTIGIVSASALTYSGRFSPMVDNIYIVNDQHWGGYVAGTDRLVGTTQAYLAVSREIHAFGGGENTAVTLAEAQKRGIVISYTQAEMNHAIADAALQTGKLDKARVNRYRGAAFDTWQRLRTAN